MLHLFCSDTILKKYSSTVATIFTGIASAALFGHTLTINFILGISIVFISMHQVPTEQKSSSSFFIVYHFVLPPIPMLPFSFQFFSPLSKVKDEEQNGKLELMDIQDDHRCIIAPTYFLIFLYSRG